VSLENTDVYFSESDELGILGACLIGSTETAADAVAQMHAGLLTNDTVRESLDLVDAILKEGGKPGMDTLGRAWKKVYSKKPMPIEVWSKAMDSCPSEHNLSYHVQGVREAFTRRRLREAGQRLVTDSGNSSTPVDAAISQLEAGISMEQEVMPATANSKTVVSGFLDALQDRWATRGKLSGVTSGIQMLDRMTDGIQFGELFLVAARPSIGKTAMGVSITQVACVNEGVPTLFVTAEMSEKALMRRLVSTVAGVPMQTIKTADLDEGDFKKIGAAGVKISRAPLHFLDVSSGGTVSTITASIRRAVRRHKVKLVIIDYLQKIQASGKHEKRTYEVGEVSTKLKGCAVASNVAMVCLAQINRESEKEKNRTPKLSDLAESGQIERDADTVCLLDRNRSEPRGEAKLIIAKQRDGECGIVKLWYEGQFCRFTGISPIDE
jgi:replicative DNA helicase